MKANTSRISIPALEMKYLLAYLQASYQSGSDKNDLYPLKYIIGEAREAELDKSALYQYLFFMKVTSSIKVSE